MGWGEKILEEVSRKKRLGESVLMAGTMGEETVLRDI